MGDAKILGKILGGKKERREMFLPKVGNGSETRGFPQQSQGGPWPLEQYGTLYSRIRLAPDLTVKAL